MKADELEADGLIEGLPVYTAGLPVDGVPGGVSVWSKDGGGCTLVVHASPRSVSRGDTSDSPWVNVTVRLNGLQATVLQEILGAVSHGESTTEVPESPEATPAELRQSTMRGAK